MAAGANRLEDAPALKMGGDDSARRSQEQPQYMLVPPHRIEPNPHQPRKHFDPAALEALAVSIKSVGLLEPLVVRAGCEPGVMQLIAGERRLRACQMAGLKLVPCVVRGAGPGMDLAEMAIVENALREDLAPLEEAEAYAKLRALGYSLERLGELTGKAKSTLSEIISIAGLPPSIKERMHDNKGGLPRRALVEIARIDKRQGPSAALEAFESARAGAKRRELKARREPRPQKAKTDAPPTAELRAARAADMARGLAALLHGLELQEVSRSNRVALKTSLRGLAQSMDKNFLALKKLRLDEAGSE